MYRTCGNIYMQPAIRFRQNAPNVYYSSDLQVVASPENVVLKMRQNKGFTADYRKHKLLEYEAIASSENYCCEALMSMSDKPATL